MKAVCDPSPVPSARPGEDAEAARRRKQEGRPLAGVLADKADHVLQFAKGRIGAQESNVNSMSHSGEAQAPARVSRPLTLAEVLVEKRGA